MKIRKEFLPFSRPSIGKDEINKVITCLKSGWITTGALCKEFEDNFCQAFQVLSKQYLLIQLRPECILLYPR